MDPLEPVAAASLEREAGLSMNPLEDVAAASLEREAGLGRCASREAAVRTMLASQRTVRQNANTLHQESISREGEFMSLMRAERDLRSSIEHDRLEVVLFVIAMEN